MIKWTLKYLPGNLVVILANNKEVAKFNFEDACFFSYQGKEYIATSIFYNERIQELGALQHFECVDKT